MAECDHAELVTSENELIVVKNFFQLDVDVLRALKVVNALNNSRKQRYLEI